MPTALVINLNFDALALEPCKGDTPAQPRAQALGLIGGEDVDEPFRAILLHSPGRKPWVRY